MLVLVYPILQCISVMLSRKKPVMVFSRRVSQISKQLIKTYMRVLRLPEVVQVTISVDSLYLVSPADGEADLRSIDELQDFALVALLGNQRTS